MPEAAARMHVEYIIPVINQALVDANISPCDLDGIAVTNRPGLVGALLVGVTAGKTLAWIHGKPIIAVHHLEGHLYSNFLQAPDLEFPFVCLIARQFVCLHGKDVLLNACLL